MDINERLRIVGKITDINSPQDSSLKIGDKFKTLDEYQLDAIRAEKKVGDLESTVERQSQRLTMIQQEIENVDDVIKELNDALVDADIPALEDSIGNLNEAVSDLIDAVDSIPDYDPATETADGLMSAADKSKLNLITVLESINLDNVREKLNLLEVSENVDLDAIQSKLDLITVINEIDLDDLQGKLDLITVTEPIDLDDLLERVRYLENEKEEGGNGDNEGDDPNGTD